MCVTLCVWGGGVEGGGWSGGGPVQYNACGFLYWPLLYKINANYYCHTGGKFQILMLDECHLNEFNFNKVYRFTTFTMYTDMICKSQCASRVSPSGG